MNSSSPLDNLAALATALYFVYVSSYFSCRANSSSMFTWKYWVGAVLVAGDLVLGIFDGGDSGEGGGVVGFLMVGDGVISAVCDWRWYLMVVVLWSEV